MDPATITGFVLAFIAIVSLLIAWRQERMAHKDHKNSQFNQAVQQIAYKAIEPVKDSLAIHTTQMTQLGDRCSRIEDSVKENSSYIRDMTEKISQMGVKVDTYWNTLESLAMNAAKGLHQPHPERARVDHLLEAFVEGTLTPEERTELKKILVQIRNYEPGTTLDFPVFPGEQTFAAILLSTMDIVNPQRMAAMGHAMHRSARDKEERSGGK
jgi:hypothetical protein